MGATDASVELSKPPERQNERLLPRARIQPSTYTQTPVDYVGQVLEGDKPQNSRPAYARRTLQRIIKAVQK